MKRAALITTDGKLTPNGREMIMQLRYGAKGRGRLIHRVIYWPWARKSVETADRIMAEAARTAGVEIVLREAEEGEGA